MKKYVAGTDVQATHFQFTYNKWLGVYSLSHFSMIP